MNLHEYQSKALFAEYGIPVPKGQVATTPAEAKAAATALGGNLWVVKAQVHAGGRGKAGGVKLAKSGAEVEQHAKAMLGTRLVTHQSGAEGLPIDFVYVEAGSAIDRELYLSLVVDRSSERIAVMASSAGGMDIEAVAHDTPEKILTLVLHPAACSRSTPRSTSRTTRCSARNASPRCATKRRKTSGSASRTRTISTTSRSTATSPAWSTAPGSRWRRWI